MLFVSFFFFLIGALVKYGKFYFLIAGYNTMTSSERKNYHIEGIASVFRNGLWLMATILLIAVAFSWYLNHEELSLYGLFIAIAIGLPYILISANSSRFKKNYDDNKSNPLS